MGLPILLLYILGIIKLHGFLVGSLGWQEIRHHSATSHKAQISLFPTAAAAVIKASYDFFLPKLGIIFCLSMTITLIWPQASVLFLWKAFPFTTTHVRKLLFWARASVVQRDMLLPCLSLIHKHNSSTGVGGNFFFSLQKDVTFGVCGVSVREQKSLARGFQPAGGFPHSEEERREGSLDTAGCAEAFIQLN